MGADHREFTERWSAPLCMAVLSHKTGVKDEGVQVLHQANIVKPKTKERKNYTYWPAVRPSVSNVLREKWKHGDPV